MPVDISIQTDYSFLHQLLIYVRTYVRTPPPTICPASPWWAVHFVARAIRTHAAVHDTYGERKGEPPALLKRFFVGQWLRVLMVGGCSVFPPFFLEPPLFSFVVHSVVKPGIASNSCAGRFLCNFYTKMSSEIWFHLQLNPKFSCFWDIWDIGILSNFFHYFYSILL